MIKVKINSDVMLVEYTLIWCDENDTLPLWFSPKYQTHNPYLIMRKKNQPTKIEGHAIKYMTSAPQNCQGHQEQEKSEKLS